MNTTLIAQLMADAVRMVDNHNSLPEPFVDNSFMSYHIRISVANEDEGTKNMAEIILADALNAVNERKPYFPILTEETQ